MHRTGKLLLPASIVCASLLLLSQMPDWKFFRDRQGNAYYVDQGGKIRITDTVAYDYRAVSPRGIDYFLNYGSTLLKEHRVLEGLSVLKSIRALPSDNARIEQAQVRATEIINTLKKRNGPRFTEQNEAASLLFVESDGGVRVINDRMYYSLRGPAGLSVIRKNNRAGLDYRYEGVLFGARSASPAGEGARAFDFLIAVDSERYGVPFKNLEQAVQLWRGIIGYDGLERTVIEKREDRVVYAFSNRGVPRYNGVEAVFVNGRFTHCARVISSESGYRASGAAMNGVMKSFRIVSSQD
jgi:hypothetical protein